MGLKQNISQSLEMKTSAVTNSFVFVLGTFFFYISMLGVEVLPSILGTIFVLLFLIFWLGFPVAFHYDKKYVAANSEWNPSKWYYLGLLPGYLGIAFVGYYVYRRKEYFSN